MCPISRVTAKWVHAERESERSIVCAGRRMFHAGGSPARPSSKRGLKPKAGDTPRRVWKALTSKEKLEDAMVYGDVTWAPSRKHSGCARAAYG